MEVKIRKARSEESSRLTQIAFSAKRYWNYPEEYFEIWKNELTISGEYINKNLVYVAEVDGTAVGFFSIVEVTEDYWAGKVFVKKGFWLDNLFVIPEYIGKGIGRKLMQYAESLCREKGISSLSIFSDPNARGFYEKMGAVYKGETPSSIENRTLPLYEYNIL